MPAAGRLPKSGGEATFLGMLYPRIDRLRQIVSDEARLRCEQGCDAEPFQTQIAAADSAEQLLEIYAALGTLEPRRDFTFVEPVGLAEIRASRPGSGPQLVPPTFLDHTVANRIYGAWIGRCAGLVLGKPFECQTFGEDYRQIKTYLQFANAWPLRDYPPGDPGAARVVKRESLPWLECQQGHVQYVPPDDDIHYTIMGLEVLEAKGAAFTTADVARWWMHKLVPTAVYTAEEAAYRNLIWLSGHFEPEKLTAAEWAAVRGWLNPYREWIGAQIRADGWAYACPGAPELAAEFAYRDAVLSHERNGVYGEMFCAAMIAAALVSDDPDEIVAAGLAQIPAQSRLADAVQRTIAHCARAGDDAKSDERVRAWLWQEFGQYHAVHTINNAAAVVAALVRGRDDFERVITFAVLCGWDTDCNGATAGSICGAMRGAAELPDHWVAPLKDTLRVGVAGYAPAAISACAERHLAIVRRLRQTASK